MVRGADVARADDGDMADEEAGRVESSRVPICQSSYGDLVTTRCHIQTSNSPAPPSPRCRHCSSHDIAINSSSAGRRLDLTLKTLIVGDELRPSFRVRCRVVLVLSGLCVSAIVICTAFCVC